ncbi:MAG: ABC transporter ATP-binding protein [Oenococcus sp.]|uniref:ATP-binding cassette domain-containing protein n=1 Tax=Oenococcus sp. TaxID=1979414 RepID=UPI0039EC9AA2
MSIIDFKNQNIEIDGQTILQNINLSINAGDFILLSGASGSGKTTFINELVAKYDKTAARVFQSPDQQFTMETPFYELVFLLENLQYPPDQIENKINQILTEFHLENKKNQLVDTLSGGEQQRLALAEAVNLGTQLVILDEPFASIDRQSIRFLLAKVQELQRRGRTIVIADHNPLIYNGLAQRIFLFDKHTITSLPKTDFRQFYDSFKRQNHFHLKSDFQSDRIKIDRLSISFPDQIIFDQASALIPDKSSVLIVGENGTGKSTLLKAISGLQEFNGKITSRGKISLAFQNPSDSFLKITVQEELSLSQHKSFHEAMAPAAIEDWLTRLSLKDRLDASVYTLSGGEKKKLQLLLLVIQSPDTILLDEPFAGLDQKSVLDLIALLKTSAATKIFISHQLFAMDQIIDHAYQVQDHKLIRLAELS